MCVFSRPKPPPLPEPRPTAPRPEQTARRVVVGDQRSSKRRPGESRRGRGFSRRLGTASLRIPLLNDSASNTGNLRY
jgi:hypothetical protein